MLSEVMAHYGLTRELDHVGYFETAQHQHLMAEIKKRLFAMFEARAKSFRSRPLCAFDGCVHFEDRTPCAE